MRHTSPVTDIIGRWPTRAALAKDLGVSVDRVHKWAQSGSIPQQFLLPVVKAAAARGFGISAFDVIAAHASSGASNGKCSKSVGIVQGRETI